MNPELFVQVAQLVIVGVGVVFFAANTFLRRVGADTEQVRADTKKDEAVTALALMNYQERKDLSESVAVLRDKLSYLQGQYDKEQQIATAKVEALEKQMKELGVTYENRILVLENEIKDLNKTITARDATITELKEQVKTLSETVAKFLAAQTAPPRTGAVTNTQGAIPIELTVSGGISAISPEKQPPHEDIA